MTACQPPVMRRLGLGKRSVQGGFSLVEMMVAAVLMLIATAGSVVLFNYSISQNRSSRGKQEEQSAISEDLANIQTMNDRYTCSTPSSCSVTSSDPGENSYYASGTTPSTGTGSFDEACQNGNLINNLITAINNKATPTAFTRLGITRTVAKTTNSAADYLRYTVTWTSSTNARLRQITLVPTASGWCP